MCNNPYLYHNDLYFLLLPVLRTVPVCLVLFLVCPVIAALKHIGTTRVYQFSNILSLLFSLSVYVFCFVSLAIMILTL